MSGSNISENFLRRGIELQEKKRYTEALVCFEEGVQYFINRLQVEPHQITKDYLYRKIQEFEDRAKAVKRLVMQNKRAGRFHEHVHIEYNSTGHSYKALFGRFLDEHVRFVRIEDPYIRSFNQCQNFLRVCELLVHSCVNLTLIELVTGSNENGADDQQEWFGHIALNLGRHNIRLNVMFDDFLLDKQIMLSSGWIIKIGRGLDIYKPTHNRFCLGVYDLDFRTCHETTVDIFHKNHLRLDY